MIYTRTGAGITIDGTHYFVGMHVHANKTSDYAGLYGIVTEIRTDDDRETENDTPDIYCQFDAPVLPTEVEMLEVRFSELYLRHMTIEEISLDMVIMAPDMLEPSINPIAANASDTVWAVIEDWAVDDEAGHNESLFVCCKDACAVFHSQLNVEATEGCILRWNDHDDYRVDHGEDFYECWLDGDYNSNHYKISLEEKPLVREHRGKEQHK